MINFSKYKVILWDFDGVIMNSMPVRDKGFELVLAAYPNAEVEQLMNFHRNNGGLSRYIKFRHFFEQIRKEAVTEERINVYAEEFSTIMRHHLTNAELLIQDSNAFIERMRDEYEMYVVSGSDDRELNFICGELGIQKNFKAIYGSPTGKKEWISTIIERERYKVNEMMLIGDSINDFEAAKFHDIDFYGYNANKLKNIGCGYIESFNPLNIITCGI